METIIEAYFKAWIENDPSRLPEIFAEDVVYSECYGPEYNGLNQILQWFQEWHKYGKVFQWKIKQILKQNRTCAVEWYFECEYQNEHARFDGVSLIQFSVDQKIITVKEFESKAEHTYPYGKLN